jgi:hypothetical protein
MRALSLNFERKATSAKFGYAVATIGIIVAGMVIGAQAMVHQEIEPYTEVTTPDSRPVVGGRPLQRGVASQAEALAGAHMIAGNLAGPREKLFSTLEAIEEPDVALLALTPDTQKRTLRIYAEARSLGAMLSYLRALEQSRTFADVVLVEHEILDNDPQRPLRFSLAAVWRQ